MGVSTIFTLNGYNHIFLEDLKYIPTDELLDMLIKHTLDYTHMFNEGVSGQKLAHYEYLLTFIQSEIARRRTSSPETAAQE